MNLVQEIQQWDSSRLGYTGRLLILLDSSILDKNNVSEAWKTRMFGSRGCSKELSLYGSPTKTLARKVRGMTMESSFLPGWRQTQLQKTSRHSNATMITHGCWLFCYLSVIGKYDVSCHFRQCFSIHSFPIKLWLICSYVENWMERD